MSDRVWIHAHVEDMQERDEYIAYPRAEWDAMTVQQRDDAIEEHADAACSSAGGYGAGIVDESEVPAYWLGLDA